VVVTGAGKAQAKTCNSVCNQLRSACRSAAKAAYNVEKLRCAHQRESCTENCAAATAACRESAKRLQDDDRKQCDDRRAACREACAAPVAPKCAPACKATAQMCKREAARTQKACSKDCPRGATRRDCVRSCRGRTNNALHACAEQVVDCLGTCANLPAQPPDTEPEPPSPQGTRAFQLGAGQTSPQRGTAAIVGDSSRGGPDWNSLFDSAGKHRDDHPPGGNGIPDYVELHAGRWAVFMGDDVSLGTAPDFTALKNGDGLVHNGDAPAAHDLGNSYVYLTIDANGDTLIYGAFERLAAGDSHVEFEFNQAHIRLGHGPPWEITGGRTTGDVRVRVHFWAGAVDNTVVEKWAPNDPWQTITSVPQQGCNAEGTACVISNATAIDGGPWQNFDNSGNAETIAKDCFVEFVINVGALVGSQPDFTSIQVRTPADIAFGHFREGN
jgi:hypothetical protein